MSVFSVVSALEFTFYSDRAKPFTALLCCLGCSRKATYRCFKCCGAGNDA